MIRETRTRQRGQSIVVALLVLLLLGLAGALFVTIVARNVLNARHASRVVTADQYARAGITFADAQLSNSLDGADWRPPLQYKLLNPPTEPRELARYNVAAANLPALTALPYSNDPDLKYLEAGFARYNTGAGRFLLRVTYTPVLLRDTPTSQYYDPVIKTDANGQEIPVSVPPGKYLKIESIGREGVIDPQDPTTYGNNRSSDRLQAYQVAYKPIGITDYARFETNPDNRSSTADIGVTSRFYAQDTDGGIATAGAYDFLTDPASPNTPVLDSMGHPTYQIYPVFTTYGAADAFKVVNGLVVPNPQAGASTAIDTLPSPKTLPGGGSFHANMPVRFFGKNLFYLNNAGIDAPLYQDGLEVAGDLLMNGYDQSLPLFTTASTATKGQRASVEINPADLTKLTAAPAPASPATPTMNLFVVPSNDPGGTSLNGGFNTFGGLVRDSSPQNDINGLPRSIGRLEPPRIDALDSGSQLPRYKAIAMTSPPRGNLMTTDGKPYTPPSGDFTASRYGYGRNIYIDNTQDVQGESTAISGGSTLTDEWLNRTEPSGALAKGNWNGNFYDPPGVTIILGQMIQPADTVNNKPAVYGLRLVRGAGTTPWTGPDGKGNAGPVLDVAYSDLDHDPKNDPMGDAADNDIVIYAEGNVRVRGILSPNEGADNTTHAKYVPRHITIVSNGTSYIEGNLLKGTLDSSISVLAHDYVCINTTQFLAGANVENIANGFQYPKVTNMNAPYFLDLNETDTLLQEFNFGLTGTDTPASSYPRSSLALYMSAEPGGPGSATANVDILNSAGTSIFNTPLSQPFTTLTHLTVDLSANNPQVNSPLLAGAVGTDLFHLSVAKSPGAGDDPSAQQDVNLERVAVLPMDIRIEAVLYAQTRSFFVIPGDWFNTSSDDSLDKYISGVSRPDQRDPTLPLDQKNATARFPLYGQPIDLKITIDGTVSEAQPADVAVQTAWMLKWGWIPQYHGTAITSSATPTSPVLEAAGHVLTDKNNNPAGKPAIGLQIIYNPQAGYPYNLGSTTAPVVQPHYLRSDAYGRPLPFSPKLPVSTGLLFAGESSEPPLLQ
jgi:hypothetical protein